MARFDDEQVSQIRQVVREERATNWGRVIIWIVVVVVIALIVLIYLASQTLQPA
jgi:hypothetical protein